MSLWHEPVTTVTPIHIACIISVIFRRVISNRGRYLHVRHTYSLLCVKTCHVTNYTRCSNDICQNPVTWRSTESTGHAHITVNHSKNHVMTSLIGLHGGSAAANIDLVIYVAWSYPCDATQSAVLPWQAIRPSVCLWRCEVLWWYSLGEFENSYKVYYCVHLTL